VTIQLKPELEALVQKDVQRGSYGSVEEFVARAVEMLHEQEEWLAENRAAIAAQVEHGFEQASRGDLVDGDEARHALQERREARRQP